jgi:predicted PurR-regulated permease PerM
MEEKERTISFDFSWQGILRVIAVLAGIYILFLIKGVLAIFFVAFLLSSALGPAVDWLKRKKFPRALAAASIYAVFIFLIVLFLYFFIPTVIREAVDFSKNSPEYISKITNEFPLSDINQTGSNGTFDEITTLGTNLQSAVGKIFSLLVKIFGGILSFVLVLVLAFYMLVEDNVINKLILSVVPARSQSFAIGLSDRLQKGIGRWLRGQLILSGIIFVIVYIGLLILGVKYALILAIIAGLAEFIPYLGPLISAVPAIVVAFVQAPMMVLLVIGLYYLTHWLESHIVVPQVMGRMIGLNPIVIIAAMLIGFKLGGLVGVVLAIPLAMAVNISVRFFLENKNTEVKSDSI